MLRIGDGRRLFRVWPKHSLPPLLLSGLEADLNATGAPDLIRRGSLGAQWRPRSKGINLKR